MYNQEPCLIENIDFVKPGKGQSFLRVKLRKLLTNKLIEKTFKSTDIFDIADVHNIQVVFLYQDKRSLYFMNDKTFDQLSIDKVKVGNNIRWFIKGEQYSATQWNNQLISVVPNNFVILKVIDVQSQSKNNTISSGSQFAVLSTGVVLKVPLFIQIDDWIRVDTRSTTYISRIKKKLIN